MLPFASSREPLRNHAALELAGPVDQVHELNVTTDPTERTMGASG
jgi:hypothetical protein